MARYYTLCIKWSKNDPWTPEFGDYDRNVVREEMTLGYEHMQRKYMRIIETDDTQDAINAAVAKLNQ